MAGIENFAGDHFAAHSRVRHSAREYVRGNWHTNTIEGFFRQPQDGIRQLQKGVPALATGYLNEFVGATTIVLCSTDERCSSSYFFGLRAVEPLPATLLRFEKNSRRFGMGTSKP